MEDKRVIEELPKILGDFKTVSVDSSIESLSLRFSPNYIPLKQRWRNNGLSADFLGDYVTCFYPEDDKAPATASRQAEIKGAVTYIANELIENAMKYTDPLSESRISMALYLTTQDIIFVACNPLTTEQNALYREFIRVLHSSDTEQLYLHRLEVGSRQESGAGLGCLTMINDYNAKLAWHFDDSDLSNIRVNTQVTITI